MFCPLKNTKRNVSDPNLLMSFSHLNFFPFKFGSKCDVCWFENAHISKRLNKNWIKSMVTQLDKAVLWSSPPPSLENPSPICVANTSDSVLTSGCLSENTVVKKESILNIELHFYKLTPFEGTNVFSFPLTVIHFFIQTGGRLPLPPWKKDRFQILLRSGWAPPLLHHR